MNMVAKSSPELQLNHLLHNKIIDAFYTNDLYEQF